MSILGKLFGLSDSSETQVNHPCQNCPGSCEIYPDACSVCQPYKEKMADAIYNVEHKDEIISKYEVVTDASGTGATMVCPYCGGNTADFYTCEYCGSKLQEGDGKIKVKSASEIPNPVLDCQDLIFERYAAVSSYSTKTGSEGILDAVKDIMQDGLLDTILSDIAGTSDDSSSIGNKMTEDEIEDMASYYGVSVSTYLTGLDNGKYLTLSAKEKCDNARKNYSSAGFGAAAGGAAILAGSHLGSGINGGRHDNPPMPPRDDRRMNDGPRPNAGFGNNNPGRNGFSGSQNHGGPMGNPGRQGGSMMNTPGRQGNPVNNSGRPGNSGHSGMGGGMQNHGGPSNVGRSSQSHGTPSGMGGRSGQSHGGPSGMGGRGGHGGPGGPGGRH